MRSNRVDGLQATKQLRSLGYNGPIIAITALGTEELKQFWFQAGCEEFLETPLNKTERTKAITALTVSRTEKN